MKPYFVARLLVLSTMMIISKAVYAPIFAQITPSNNSFALFDSYVLKTQRTQSIITLDGKLTEDIWKTAPVIENFFQHYPTDSLPADKRVQVQSTYDDTYLYFGISCFDSTAGEFYFQSLRRDFTNIESDCVVILIDPLGIGQTGFSFRVSPRGVQSEGFVANGGNTGLDLTWDNVWFAETAVEKDRWTVEIAIPFRAIRFESGRKNWRINILRFDWKVNQLSSWTRYPINFGSTSLAHTGRLEWDTPPQSSSLNMSIIPSATVLYNRSLIPASKDQGEYNIGGDIKYGITPNLNLDATIFPDFSNVGVDRQITNLSRFSIFFPEQRQFFIENSDLFSQFGVAQVRPFFSRTIGLTNDPLNNGMLAPLRIPLGVRLTGNLDENWRVGILSMQTATSERLMLATQNYSVGALQRRVFGRSNIGIIFVNRQGRNFNEEGNDFNRTLGADFNLLSDDGTWQGKVFFHQNFTPTQHGDQFASAGWLRYSIPGIEINWNHEYIGTYYKPEVGFAPRTGVWRWQPVMTRTFYPDNRTTVNEHSITLEQDTYFDNSGRFTLLDNSSFLSYNVNFANTMNATLVGGSIYTRLTFPFDPTGRGNKDNELSVGEYKYWRFGADFSSDIRSLLIFSGSVRAGGYFNGSNINIRGSLGYRFQPFGSITLAVQQDHITLPQPLQSAQLTLASLLLDLTPTRNIFMTAFFQYNTQLNNVNLNTRIQWRFAPMSDVFLVYTDNFDATTFALRTRSVALKLTYWLNI